VGLVVEGMRLEVALPCLDLELGIPAAAAAEPMEAATPEQRLEQSRRGAGWRAHDSLRVGTAATVARDGHPAPRPDVEHLPRAPRHGLVRRSQSARRSAYKASQAHVPGICGEARCRRGGGGAASLGVVTAAAGDARHAVHGAEVRAVGWIPIDFGAKCLEKAWKRSGDVEAWA
jgi:hypothetical protein